MILLPFNLKISCHKQETEFRNQAGFRFSTLTYDYEVNWQQLATLSLPSCTK